MILNVVRSLVVIFTIQIIHVGALSAQTDPRQKIDSINSLLKTQRKDTTYMKMLFDLSEIYKQIDQDKQIMYVKQCLELAEKQGSQKYQVLSLNAIGWYYTLSKVGDIALEYYTKGLKIANESQKKDLQAVINQGLGLFYWHMQDGTKAIGYALKSLTLFQEVNNRDQEAFAYTLLGIIDIQLKKYKDAISNFERSLKILETTNNPNYSITVNQSTLCEAYFYLGEYSKSLEYGFKAIENGKLYNRSGLAFTYKDIANVYFILGDYQKSIEFYKMGLGISKQFNDKDNQQKNLIGLKNAYLKTKEFLLAIESQDELIQLKDSASIAENTKKIELFQSRYKEQKNESRIALLEKDNLLKVQASNRQQVILYIFIAASVVILIFIILLLRNIKQKQVINQKINQQNEELKQSQEELQIQRDYIESQVLILEQRQSKIKNSMNAAVTIQQAILPYQRKLDTLLKEYFIIYEPKDVVSGDFYWLNKIEDTLIFIVADCTGHGVPGAFMTLIGNTLLDKIIRLGKFTDPAEILTKLHKEVRVVLKQKDTQNNNGMDIAIIAIRELPDSKMEITFAGAKNDLFYIAQDDSTLYELKGDRKAIGGKQNKNIPFTNKSIVLDKQSVLYLGSDGFEDQNDVKRRKFGRKKLKELIKEVSKNPLENQKETFLSALQKHMNRTEQRDDILLVGIRI